MNKPELVCPAGDWASLYTAVESGADSVYFGVKDLNMRNLADNFDLLELPKVLKFLHSHKVKGYLALNVFIKNSEIPKVRDILTLAKRSCIDGVILWDTAVLAIAKELDIPIHLSTQASVTNIEALAFYSRQGVKRVVLARECSLEDIKDIIVKAQNRDIQTDIETFIHGAMCLSVSGRCFLSSYSFGEAANRGECIQPCRREYLIKDTDNQAEYIIGKDYILSPKDLCTAEFIDKLIEIGIAAFKIEGRKRSPEYIKVVVSVYRALIDAYFENRLTPDLKKESLSKLKKVYHRGFSSGFYLGEPCKDKSIGSANEYHKLYVGQVRKFYKRIGVAEIIVKDKELKKGDNVLFIGKKTPARFEVIEELQQEHEFVDKIPKGEKGGVKISFKVRPKDKVFLWKEKEY